MIGRFLLAALFAGVAAGVVIGVIQHVRMTPMILAAEVFEQGLAHGVANHVQDVFTQRAAFTVLTTAITGAGFAAILLGLSMLFGIAINRGNGIFWGLCGFIAVALAPAAGLPPELPGIPAAEFDVRLQWWLLTIVCTTGALWLVITQREAWALGLALVAVLLPHVIGAPPAASTETAVPAMLLSTFVANSLGLNALFWAMIGLFLGIALERFEKESQL
jgi:cobalt transporter subunit CbtA